MAKRSSLCDFGGIVGRLAGAWVVGAAFAAGVPAARAAVPPPSQMAAEIIVSGRTSTARNIEIVRTGDEIPTTFSGGKVNNTRGFSWWVSRHYALKTDYPEEKARAYLTLLEMAYPHYAELFGREPAEIGEKRMTVCYASSLEKLKAAMASDNLRWNFGGGGITFEGYNCAYVYPSGTLDYHQRYILLHECTHLYQMCLNGSTYTTPAWHYEGVADALSSHVVDSKNRRATFFVLDKPTTHDYFDEGMAERRKRPLAPQEIHAAGSASRGLTFLLVHFLMDDPDRAQKFRLWRDAMFLLNRQRHTAESDRLMREIFGPWDKINADFQAWLASVRHTFHYAAWGWEQDADTLWSYGFAPDNKLSQTDVYLPPGEKPAYHPLRMDYPLQPMPPLVGPVERGTAAPSVGGVIDFSRCPGRGRAGIGLGLTSAGDIKPWAADSLFVDEAGSKPGVTVVAYRVDKILHDGRAPDDVKNGPRLGESIDPTVGLELPRSITQGLKSHFVVEWNGYLRLPKDDRYALATTSDDGSWLWVDDALVVSNGGVHPPATASASVPLAGGMHRLRVRYFQEEGERFFEAGLTTGPPPGCLRLLVERERDLLIDGSDLGLAKQTVTIPAEVREAAAGDHRLGLTARIGRDALEVALRGQASAAKAPVEFKAWLPLTGAARARLLSHPLAIFSRDGWHGVTPYFDDRRRPEPDLSAPAPPNRWRNPGDKPLAALYRAAWLLKDKTPPSLAALKAAMLAAADKEPAAQQRALAAWEKAIAGILKDVAAGGAPADATARALDALRASLPKT